MIKEAIVKIVNKGDLSYDEAYAVMNEMEKHLLHRMQHFLQHFQLRVLRQRLLMR